MSDVWGPQKFDQGSPAWIDVSLGIDSLSPTGGGLEVEASPPYGIVTGAGVDKDHRIGTANAGRGLLNTQTLYTASVSDPYYFPTVLDLLPSPVATCAAVHNCAADTASVSLSFKMRASVDRGGATNPEWDDPDDAAHWFVGGDPDEGSDKIEVGLDITQDSSTGIGSPAGVDYTDFPTASIRHMGHFIGWPFRVRMDRSASPVGYVNGPLGIIGTDFDPLGEGRVYKVTTSSGITQYQLHLVWWGENVPPGIFKGNNEVSQDYIVLAVYDTLGFTPTWYTSPFFHVPSGSAFAKYNKVEISISCSVFGSVTMRVEALDGDNVGYVETLSIGGGPVYDGGTDGSGNPIGLKAVDVGVWHAQRPSMSDVDVALGLPAATTYPGELGYHELTWAMDDLEGTDFASLEGTSGQSIFSDAFSTGLAVTSQQTCTLTAYPRAGRDIIWIEESSFQAMPPSWQGVSAMKNWKSDAMAALEQVFVGATLSLDMDGAVGGDVWSNPLNINAMVERTLGGVGGSLGVSVDTPAVADEYLPPSESFPAFPSNKAVFAFIGGNHQAHKLRFRTSTYVGSTFDNPAPEGSLVSEYTFSVLWTKPIALWNSTAFTYSTVRARQTEIFLFGDNTVETDAGVSVGEGTPPKGIGLRFRHPDAGDDFVLDFFIEGSTSSDVLHTIKGLGDTGPTTYHQGNVSDIILQAVDDGGGTVTMSLWVNGRRFYTNAAGTADQTISASEIAANFTTGIGLQAVGWSFNSAGTYILNGMYALGHGARGWCITADKYQKRYVKKIDTSKADYEQYAPLEVTNEGPTTVHDFVCAGESVTPYPWINQGRVRAAWPDHEQNSHDSFAVYSLIDPDGGTESQPFPGHSEPILWQVTAEFPCAMDEQLASGVGTYDLIAYRGFTMRSTPDSWVTLTPPTSTDTAYGSGPGVSMYIPKGISAVLWGNPSDLGSKIGLAGTKVVLQLFAVNDSGTTVASSGKATLYSPSAGELPLGDEVYFQIRMSEDKDPVTGDRTYLAEVFAWNGTAFDTVATASVVLTLTQAQFASFTGSQTSVMRYYRWATVPGSGPTSISTTWLNRIAIASSVPTVTQRYDTLASVAQIEIEKAITGVRGTMNAGLFSQINGVRGVMAGVVPEDHDKPIRRRILIFERDSDGDVPGSYNWIQKGGSDDPSVADSSSYFKAGTSFLGDAWWGNPKANYDEQTLKAIHLTPVSVTIAPKSPAAMVIRQDGIHWSGGHLRVGQLIVYVERITGALPEVESTTGVVFGGNGVKVLFRGEIVQVNRDQVSNTVTYICQDHRGTLDITNILQLSHCEIGQIAFNVEPGSVNTAYAVSKNFIEKPSETPPEDGLPEGFGQVLGPGIPDLVGMTLADIVDYVVNLFKHELNALGVLRLDDAGELVVVNKDTTDGYSATWGTVSKAELASIMWAPNREAFDIIPPETVLKGNIGTMLEQLMKMAPDARWRIEPSTLRWVFEKVDSLEPVSLDVGSSGTVVNITDDSTGCATRVIYASPWQKQYEFLAKYSDGTLVPFWFDGFEGEWMGPFGQIGMFLATVTEALNFPYYEEQAPTDPETGKPVVPQSTVIKAFMSPGDSEFPVATFTGATCKVISGAAAGKQATVKVGSIEGYNPTLDLQSILLTVEPAFPGGYGDESVLQNGDEIQISDDPTEGTTESASAWSSTWIDYVIIDPTTGTPASNLIQTGVSTFYLQTPSTMPPYSSGDIYQMIKAGAVISGGSVISSAFPLLPPGTQCAQGAAVGPNIAGYNGELLFKAVRIQEGVWCVSSPAPEDGFAGTAWSDLDSIEGVVKLVHADGLGIVDTVANWQIGRWAPRGGAFAQLMIIGGAKTVFDTDDIKPATFPQNDLNQNVSTPFDGGWTLDVSDVDQTLKPLEERSVDTVDDVAEWNQPGGGDAWSQQAGIAFKTLSGTYGQMRGSVLTRFIPANYSAPHYFDVPDLTLGLDFGNSSVNNNLEIDALLVLDLTDAITSLCQIGVVVRAENGWVEQRRVPQEDYDLGSSLVPFFDGDPLIGVLVGSMTSQVDLSAEAKFKGAVGINVANQKAYTFDGIPDWISSEASKKKFKQTSRPSLNPSDPGYATYHLKRCLTYESTAVLDSRYFKGAASEYEGTDQVTNGDFSSGVSGLGWTHQVVGGVGDELQGVAAGYMVWVWGVGTNVQLFTYQTINIISGKTYRVRGQVENVSGFAAGTAEFQLSINTSGHAKDGDIAYEEIIGLADGEIHEFEFEFTAASSATVTLALWGDNKTHNQITVRWDNIQVLPQESGIVDVTSRFNATSSVSWPTAKRLGKMGLEFGTTGYVFRFVRGDEPDCLNPNGTELLAYPTLFWYHLRRGVDPTTGEQALDTAGQPVFEGCKEIIWQGNPIAAASLGDGEDLRLRLTTQMKVPFGMVNKLQFQLTGLEDASAIGDGQFYGEKTHDSRAMLLRQGETAAGGLLSGGNGDDTSLTQDEAQTLTSKFDIFGLTGFDGNYSGWHQGFSMVRGAGGFGMGIVKSVMTNPDQSGPDVGLWTDIKPAKVTRMVVRKINTPIFELGGPLGLDPVTYQQILSQQFDNAVGVEIVESGQNYVRFKGDTSGLATGVPLPGDKYKIVFERGWRVAKTLVFQADGLDGPNKIWLYKHMADAELNSRKDKRYQGTIELEGIAYELGTLGRTVSLHSQSAYTGLELAKQQIGSITFQLDPDRRTLVSLNQDIRGEQFSRLQELYKAFIAEAEVFQKPYFLGANQDLASAKKQQAIDSGAPVGSDFFAAGYCGQNVYLPDFSGGKVPLSLSETNDTLLYWLENVKILVDANKEGSTPTSLVDDGDGGISPAAGVHKAFSQTSAERDGRKPRGRKQAALYEIIQARLRSQGKAVFDVLVDDHYAVRDGDDYYSMMIVRGRDGEPSARWAHVEPDPDRPGRWQPSASDGTRVPREAGTGIDSSIDGTASSYVLDAHFRNPIVQVVAAVGYSGPAGVLGSASAGDVLDGGICGGFRISYNTSDSTKVTVSASSTFGPCLVYLTH